jgi:hypothetical protein
MSSGFMISFNNNGDNIGYMYVAEDMKFCELVENLSKYFALKKEDETTFYFDSKEIKSSSEKKLKELGIKSNSIIEVKTKIPINNSLNNNSSMGMNPNSFMGMNNNSFMGMNPNSFMGMNPFPLMGMNNINNMHNMDENIQIIFNYSGNVITLQANIGSPFSELSKRFCKEAGIQDNNLVYSSDNGDILPSDNRSLNQLYLHNNSLIFVSLNIIIIFNNQGKPTLVQATNETRFSDLCKLYVNITGIQGEDPVFLLHSHKLESNDCRTLTELKIRNQERIEVIFPNEVIAA